MSQIQEESSCFNPSIIKIINFNNTQQGSYNNINQNSNLNINNDNSISKSEQILNELNTTTDNNENEYTDDNSEDFISKKIDLSFLDIISNDTVEKNYFHNNENNTNIYYSNNNFSNLPNDLEIFSDQNSEQINLNEANNKLLYKIMQLNNLYQNYNYYQQLTYINNLNLAHSQYLMNNQNNINQNSPKKENHLSNKANALKKIKKNIDKKYLINLMDIKTNKEQRTTIRMMNIPSYFRPIDLAKKLDEKFGISPQKENRVYDFIYIPFKESKKNEGLINAGYAFINFVHPKHILKFCSFFQGKHLKLKTSGKVCLITFASRQGTNINQNGSNDKYMYFSDTKNHFQLLTD